jgi:oligogalacturonide lyase
MTRRTLLSFLPGSLLATQAKRTSKPNRPQPARGEFFRFADGVTENPVVRLTPPTHQSVLPEPENRFVSSRESFLVFASDRGGRFAPYRANLRTGVITPITEATGLEPRSIALDSRERELYFLDNHALRVVDLQRGRVRTLCESVSGFHIGGRRDILVVRDGDRISRWTPTGSSLLADHASGRGIVSPAGNGCVFSRQEIEGEQEFWFASLDGGKPRRLAAGNISFPYWRPDGQALLFLRQVDRKTYVASELREAALDGSAERSIAETSQFASFGVNSDGSVFVGASRSKGQPNIVLLLRHSKREMVLCEHRSSVAQDVCPSFSPNSQRVYFQSDREGKSSLYSVNVERLVEETEDS